MANFTKENMVCKWCEHRLTVHWKEGCGCLRDGGVVIECECPGYFPVDKRYDNHIFSKFSVEDAKLAVLIELGY